jgi:hypothetical protein
MPKPPKKGPRLRLRIVDRGQARAGVPLRDVYLVEGVTGQETWMYSLGADPTLAADLAEYFRAAGVAVVEEAFGVQNLFE